MDGVEQWDALEFGAWDTGGPHPASENAVQYPTVAKRLASARPNGKKKSNKHLSHHQLEELLLKPVSLRDAKQLQTEMAQEHRTAAAGPSTAPAPAVAAVTARDGLCGEPAARPQTEHFPSRKRPSQVTSVPSAGAEARAARKPRDATGPEAAAAEEGAAAAAATIITATAAPGLRPAKKSKADGEGAVAPGAPGAEQQQATAGGGDTVPAVRVAAKPKRPAAAAGAEAAAAITAAGLLSSESNGAMQLPKLGKQANRGPSPGEGKQLGTKQAARQGHDGRQGERPADSAAKAAAGEDSGGGERRAPKKARLQPPSHQVPHRQNQDGQQAPPQGKLKQQQQRESRGPQGTQEPAEVCEQQGQQQDAPVGATARGKKAKGTREAQTVAAPRSAAARQAPEAQQQPPAKVQGRVQPATEVLEAAATKQHQLPGQQQQAEEKVKPLQIQHRQKLREPGPTGSKPAKGPVGAKDAERGTVSATARGTPAPGPAPKPAAVPAASSLAAALGGRAAAAAPVPLTAATITGAAPPAKLTHAAALAALQQKAIAAAAAAAAARPLKAVSSAGGDDDESGGEGAAGGRQAGGAAASARGRGQGQGKAGAGGFLDRMRARLAGGRFRYLNEELYTRTGDDAFAMMQDQPELFSQYHDGFQRQTRGWPKQPVDVAVAWLRAKKSEVREVADFGCGDARIAASVPQTVHSFDLVASAPGVIACNMADVPLPDCHVDAAVFSLALMGTDYGSYLEEAVRVLKPKGWLWIAEVRSRFAKADAGDSEDDGEGDRGPEGAGGANAGDEDFGPFLACLKRLGLRLVSQDASNKMFVVWVLRKAEGGGKAKSNGKGGSGIPWPTLKACMYKKR